LRLVVAVVAQVLVQAQRQPQEDRVAEANKEQLILQEQVPQEILRRLHRKRFMDRQLLFKAHLVEMGQQAPAGEEVVLVITLVVGVGLVGLPQMLQRLLVEMVGLLNQQQLLVQRFITQVVAGVQ
jgi:hypothetical protein